MGISIMRIALIRFGRKPDLQSCLLHPTGAPSTPETPIVEVNGPVALLTLRTEEAGIGNSSQLFQFSVLIYTFNSTDNTSQFVSEDVRFNSSEYRSGESIVVHVEDVMELNQLYQFAVRAINMFGVSEISDLSDPVLLNVSGMLRKPS